MSPTLWLVTSVAGLLVVAALAVLYRRAAAQRELELAEELLAEELLALEARPAAPGSGTSSPRAS